jgi:CRISPR-associated protein Cmr3
MRLALSPIDTWFFRDSTPFDKGASPQAGVSGVFPPHPSTVAGTIRAALALCNGWDGRGRWSADIEKVLGDGPDDLGRLRLTGPFVLHGGVPIFPAPRHVLGRTSDDGRWIPAGWLRPGNTRVACDLGPSTRLPEVIADGPDSAALAAGARQWMTLAGLERIVRGDLPREHESLPEADVWAEEFRVGIARESISRTAVEGALYSTRHARLDRRVSIGVEVDGVPHDWRSPVGTVLPFGGESRLAAYDAWETEVRLEPGHVHGESGCVVLIALTPILLGHDVLSGRAELPVAGGARVVCACVDRPLRIGGWDSLRRTPLPLRNALEPGSALFCEVEGPAQLAAEVTCGLLRIGDRTAAGFGLCAVAKAPAWGVTT